MRRFHFVVVALAILLLFPAVGAGRQSGGGQESGTGPRKDDGQRRGTGRIEGDLRRASRGVDDVRALAAIFRAGKIGMKT
jgi:hypothetical protein